MKRKGIILLTALLVAFVFTAPPVLETVAPEQAAASVVYAETNDGAEWNTNEWARLPRDGYGDTVQIGKYYYYYELDNDTYIYRAYRENVNTGKRKLLVKVQYKYASTPEFYTNGEKLIYSYDRLGTIIKCKNLSTSKTHTVVNLRKYRTSKSTDTHLYIHIYGKYLYYSKYRGLDTTIWKLYKVNINTGKSSIIRKNVVITNPLDQTNVSGRYFLVRDKYRNLRVYDTKDKKLRKLSGKYCKCATPINGYWYYVTSAKSGSTRVYRVWRKKLSGAGTAKRIAYFKKSYKPDTILELTDKGLFFLRESDDATYTMEYRFAKKKFIKHKDQDVWYYIGKNQQFM